MKGIRFVMGALVCVGWLAGCSSSSEVQEASTPATPPSSSQLTAYIIDGRGLVAQDVSDGTTKTIQSDIRYGGTHWPSPTRQQIALTIEKTDGLYLAVTQPSGSLQTVHGPIEDGSYTASWAPAGDSLLFGYDSNSDGGISVFAVKTGELSSVGCSSRLALSWGHDDWFVVGDGTNHYVVERDDCATLESIDARKLHEVTFGPVGKRVAYILRELEYDRDAREYRPDSSLYVSDADGLDPVLVVGDRYHPHNPSWSDDGMALAFDARLPDDESRRLISIYDVDEKRSSFMNPDAVDKNVSEWSPAWSPSGQAIAYIQSSKRDAPVVTVREMTSSFTKRVGQPGESFAGWLDDQRLVLQSGESTRIVDINGREVLTLPGPASILALGMTSIPDETSTSGSN